MFFAFCFATSIHAQNAPRVYGEHIEPHWFADGSGFWYRQDGARDTRRFFKVDARRGERVPAFDHQVVAEQIGGEASRLPIEELVFEEDRGTILLVGNPGRWRWDEATGEVSALKSVDGQTTGLPKEGEVRPSRNGGPETQITFENRLGRGVTLFWIDATGERKSYGSIGIDQTRAQHTFAGHVWLVADTSGQAIGVYEATRRPGLAVIDDRKPVARPQGRRGRPGASGAREDRTAQASTVPSPNGEWEAFVQDHDLFVRRLKDQSVTRLTRHGTPDDTFHRDATRERAVGMNYNKPDYPATLPWAYWSPDSTRLIALKTRTVEERRVYIIESSPKDQLQPRLHSYPYLKPGDPIPQSLPRLFDVTTAREIPVDTALLENPWSLSRFEWAKDLSAFRFLYNRRGHQAMRVITVDGKTGGVRSLIEETSDTFIDYSQKTYLKTLEGSGEIIWMSERNGWNHLYLYDLKTGRLINPITRGRWVVRGVDRVDEGNRQIDFRVMGIRPDQDPYHVHHARINFDGSGLTLLTPGDGTHEIAYSPDRRWYIDTWSRVDQPPVHELRRGTDGSLVLKLGKADASGWDASGRSFPERFVAKGRDGVTDIYGIIHRPRDFDPHASYPVIESIYAGPHGQHVPKGFRASYRTQQQIADRGFIVVQIDGMGTNWRSKSFHDVAWKNIADAGFPDRIAWMRGAARTRSWMDLSRVGVFGGSAGGQNAMRAVLDHADFYKAAAADCGCHDNRLDKIWWNEAWMGWPIDDSYTRSSNFEDAHKLGGALLLTVGELDRNVDPASTMRVVDALRKAEKDFELLVVPGAGHGAGGAEYGRRVRIDFFERHLKTQK